MSDKEHKSFGKSRIIAAIITAIGAIIAAVITAFGGTFAESEQYPTVKAPDEKVQSGVTTPAPKEQPDVNKKNKKKKPKKKRIKPINRKKKKQKEDKNSTPEKKD